MSRGPGIWQRRILDAVAENSPVVLTREDDSKSVQNAVRRAAKQLESKRLIELASIRIDGKPRLAAYLPDGSAPSSRLIMGLDGKTYKLPA